MGDRCDHAREVAVGFTPLSGSFMVGTKRVGIAMTKERKEKNVARCRECPGGGIQTVMFTHKETGPKRLIRDVLRRGYTLCNNKPRVRRTIGGREDKGGGGRSIRK